MEVKSIDNLLNELNNAQLSKENMACIKGGYTLAYSTSTGEVSMSYSDSGEFRGCTCRGIRVSATFLSSQGDNNVR